MNQKNALIMSGVAAACGAGVLFLVLRLTAPAHPSQVCPIAQPRAPAAVQRDASVPTSDAAKTDNSQHKIKALDFNLKDYNGKTVHLADFLGTPVVINSWAAWCPFCRKELPDFASVQKEFGNQVIIIAIDRTESKEVAKKYSDELGVTNKLLFLLDPSDSFYQSIEGFSMPETIFVDKDGFIRDHKRGPMDSGELRAKIQKLL